MTLPAPPAEHTRVEREICVGDLIERLVAHPLYGQVQNEETLRTFMRSHVFCVWDFQSLLKSLQRSLTCVELPWVPTADPESRRLVNEIVLDEESDATSDGRHLSHFELYLEAMAWAGADRNPITNLLDSLQRGLSLESALASTDLPPGVGRFVRSTFRFIDSGSVHQIAAAFTYGREDVIPEMFSKLVENLSDESPEIWSPFRYYLERHIEHDGDRHGPLSRMLVARLCGDDPRLWSEAEAAAREAIEERLVLWDEISERKESW